MTDGNAAATISRISWRLLPIIGVSYCLAYVDRVNVSFAATAMKSDLGFSATVYGLGAGLFFLSYALLEVPSNLAMQRFGPRLWMVRIMVTWGLLAAGMALVTTPLQFYVMRFLLGAAEAGFFPAVLYYLSFWFPAEWRTRAISRFYIGLPLSSVFMGVLAGPLLGLDGLLGLRGWQWMFIVQGLPAAVMGLVVLGWLPDKPGDVDWLDDGQKRWLADRMASDVEAVGGDHRRPWWQAILNPVVLPLALAWALIAGGANTVQLFLPEMLGTMAGLSPSAAGWLIAAGGLGGAVMMLLNARSSDRYQERFWHVIVPVLVSASCLAVTVLWPSPGVITTALTLHILAAYAWNGVWWAAPGEFLPRRETGLYVAAINTLGQLGTFAGPWLWGMARDASGGFERGLSVLPFTMMTAAGLVLLARSNGRAGRAVSAT